MVSKYSDLSNWFWCIVSDPLCAVSLEDIHHIVDANSLLANRHICKFLLVILPYVEHLTWQFFACLLGLEKYFVRTLFCIQPGKFQTLITFTSLLPDSPNKDFFGILSIDASASASNSGSRYATHCVFGTSYMVIYCSNTLRLSTSSLPLSRVSYGDCKRDLSQTALYSRSLQISFFLQTPYLWNPSSLLICSVKYVAVATFVLLDGVSPASGASSQWISTFPWASSHCYWLELYSCSLLVCRVINRV